MKVAIVGTGYVGLVTGVCLASLGHNVACHDIDPERIELLKSGRSPIYEPGLPSLLKKNPDIFFTTDLEAALKDRKIIFIAVDTPPLPSGEADLSKVFRVARNIAKIISDYTVIVNKSTVPVGTQDKVTGLLAKSISRSLFDVVSNPEFLREGTAIKDFLEPDRIVIGSSSDKATRLMLKLYSPIKCPKLVFDPRSAEMIKYASNAFLATKISFINEIANICEKVGADVTKVALGMGADRRIGNHFLNAGIGYGGSCFPKDTKALVQIAGNRGHDFRLLKAVIEVNSNQRHEFTRKIERQFRNLKGRKIAVLGLAFKPGTDDMREAASIEITDALIKKGAKVFAWDPVALETARKVLDKKVVLTSSLREALESAEAAVIVTEWDEIKNMDLKETKKLLKRPLIIDGRNIFSPERMEKEGFEYISVGRAPVKGSKIINNRKTQLKCDSQK